MGSSKSKKQKRAEREAKRGVLLIFFVILVIATMGYFFIKAILNEQEIDEATNCPKDGVSYHKAILIDTSSQYNPVQISWIKNQLKQIINRTEKNEKISIYVVGGDYRENLLPLQSKCNPGNPSGANPFYENKFLLEEDWKKNFFEPIEKEFNDLLNSKTEGPSPIMEMIQTISIAAFQNEKVSTKKKLFIFSDMLQNYDGVHHYKSDFNFKEFSDSAKYLTVRTDLTGVTIRVLYIRRAGAEKFQKGTAHAKFWQEYFNSMDAEGFSIKFGEG